MSAKQAKQPSFPQRDDNGRIVLLTQLLGFIAMSVALGVVMLAVIDGLLALLGFTEFGKDISGWICGVLAVFVFVDEFRAYKGQSVRYWLAPVAGLLALAFGIVISAVLPTGWLPLFTGAIGVAAAMLAYGALWFVGTRLTGADIS
ncbi:hypothetical protein [Stackebrandtia nassauensis]|uniref:Uncharacterized protein n=1 Tax=Stackebrandtia nassauensis (strain DSM 44728 / CIP 108903 / NRRL B-16338 / NBRC 102104 / LLR-40K-21) TaxID=446470 RepID=D3Q603_STANL|nr:hypothetical protein [Stackebrandtia nassauensis]ADD40302.1 hypothetical protein Snas_0588 [Stackebrandtia nassauensis DSM 44728]